MQMKLTEADLDASIADHPAPPVPTSMWSVERETPWLAIFGYPAAFFGALLVSHICARCSA